MLFIDSSHVLKIDGDVPFLYLEVLPRLNQASCIHIHDVPFPYNVPYPARLWVFGAGVADAVERGDGRTGVAVVNNRFG